MAVGVLHGFDGAHLLLRLLLWLRRWHCRCRLMIDGLRRLSVQLCRRIGGLGLGLHRADRGRLGQLHRLLLGLHAQLFRLPLHFFRLFLLFFWRLLLLLLVWGLLLLLLVWGLLLLLLFGLLLCRWLLHFRGRLLVFVVTWRVFRLWVVLLVLAVRRLVLAVRWLVLAVRWLVLDLGHRWQVWLLYRRLLLLA